MTSRSDATPLPVEDRSYLVESAIKMIEEALESMHTEAVDDGVEPDDFDLLDSIEEVRLLSYAALFQTMVTDRSDAAALIALMNERKVH